MSCVNMCFTSSPTTGDHDNTGLTNGLRTKLLQISGPERGQPKKLPVLHATISSSYIGVKNPETLAKMDAVRRPQSPAARNVLTHRRLEVPADPNTMQKRDGLSKSAPLSSEREQIWLSTGGPEKPQKQDKLAVKMRTKQVKGVIAGMGKELRRAASSVSDTLSEKLPNPTKKKSKAQKDRDELLVNAEPQKPVPRNADDIKKAYGHGTDTRHVAAMTHDKLRERGQKLSAIQRRTTELEADAANFSSLAQELVKKMENKKWYEI